jgi:hypothetical protein
MDDWILLSYKLHGTLENMIIPEARYQKPQHNWVFYAAFCAYKLFQYYR